MWVGDLYDSHQQMLAKHACGDGELGHGRGPGQAYLDYRYVKAFRRKTPVPSLMPDEFAYCDPDHAALLARGASGTIRALSC
jgi:hypothetical protein